MFWKTAKSRSKWSITFRLALIYALSAFCILIITTFSLYWIFTHRLEKDNYLFLQNKILALQKIMQAPHKHFSLKEEIVFEPALYNYYSRIIDPDGKVVIETPNMSKVAPLAAFSSITPRSLQPFQTMHWISPRVKDHKKRYLLLITAHLDNDAHQIIQMARDITSEQYIIEDYRQGLFTVLLIGTLFSVVFGVIVIRRGLKPLRDITRSTQRITLSRLENRLNPSSWPKELSLLATAFNDMLDRIEEGVNRLSQFSADLAHELRTPINNLMGEAEITLSRPRSSEEYKAVLESSLEEFQRLSYMIENLLFLARAENPEAAVETVSLCARSVMEDIRNFYEAVTEEKNIKIQCEGNGLVLADPHMLRRALSNLVSNAIKYSDSGSTITLSVQYPEDGQTHLVVRDEGEGIYAEHLPHLFDRFYRVDTARSKNTGGMGLGLAIVKSIMDLHKGRVAITSQAEKGTVVSLIFP